MSDMTEMSETEMTKMTGMTEAEMELMEAEEEDHRAGQAGLPDAVRSALFHQGTYVLGLRTGQVIRFSSALLSDDGVWVWLSVRIPKGHERVWDNQPMKGVSIPFKEGIDVRVSEIAWAATSPFV